MVFLSREADGYRVEGHSTGIEEGEVWGVRYAIALDLAWTTRTARVAGQSAVGSYEVQLDCDAEGEWRVDGASAPALAGCLDVDLEASAFTNAFPVHRLALDVGERAEAPAAYVRALDLRVERLEQTYARLPHDGERSRYHYVSPRFDYRDELVYDEFGLVLDYPGLAVRVA